VQDTETRQTTLSVARSNLVNAEQRIAAAKFASQQAAYRLSMAEKGGRREDVDIARANVAQVQAEVKRLEAQIEQTIIRAPDDGLIVKREAHIGDITTAGKPLFAMVRDNRLEMRAQVPDTDLAQIQPGQIVYISSSKNPGSKVSARVREISPQVDNASRLGTVRIDIPDDAGFLPGTFVHGELHLGNQIVLAIPSKAVVSRQGQSAVFVLNGNKVTLQAVQTGSRAEDLVEILSGVNQGDQIVVAGAGFLKDGDTVRLAPARSANTLEKGLSSP
jgi:HlyD family secretion protein